MLPISRTSLRWRENTDCATLALTIAHMPRSLIKKHPIPRVHPVIYETKTYGMHTVQTLSESPACCMPREQTRIRQEMARLCPMKKGTTLQRDFGTKDSTEVPHPQMQGGKTRPWMVMTLELTISAYSLLTNDDRSREEAGSRLSRCGGIKY